MKSMNKILKVYYKLPFRPFRKQLARMFNNYRKKDENRVVKVIRKGIKFELHLSDRVQSGIYYDFYEPTITKIFEKNLKKGDVVIDVGGNIGYYSLLSAKIVGPTGRVYSFEPMSLANERFKKNIQFNGFNNIILEKKGVSNRPEKKRIFFENEYIVGKHAEQTKENSEQIDFVSIDSYVKDKKIDRIDFLKIDTDGYDFKVLKGAINSIQKFYPKVITAEISPNDDIKDYVNLLFTLENYDVYSDVGGKTRKYSKEDLLNLIKERGIINSILIRKD